MTPLPPAGKVIRFTFIHNLVEDAHATCHLFMSYLGGPPAGSDMTSIAGGASSAYSAHLGPLLPSTFSMFQVNAQDLSSATAAYGTSTTVITGGRVGTALTVNSPTLINYLIGRKYRGGKPRGYWPFGVQTDLANDAQWGTSWVNTVNGDFGAFIVAMQAVASGTTTLSQHVNVGYYSGFTSYTGSGGRPKVRATKLATPFVDPVTNHVCNLIVGSQRRRLRATGS